MLLLLPTPGLLLLPPLALFLRAPPLNVKGKASQRDSDSSQTPMKRAWHNLPHTPGSFSSLAQRCESREDSTGVKREAVRAMFGSNNSLRSGGVMAWTHICQDGNRLEHRLKPLSHVL